MFEKAKSYINTIKSEFKANYPEIYRKISNYKHSIDIDKVQEKSKNKDGKNRKKSTLKEKIRKQGQKSNKSNDEEEKVQTTESEEKDAIVNSEPSYYDQKIQSIDRSQDLKDRESDFGGEKYVCDTQDLLSREASSYEESEYEYEEEEDEENHEDDEEYEEIEESEYEEESQYESENQAEISEKLNYSGSHQQIGEVRCDSVKSNSILKSQINDSSDMEFQCKSVVIDDGQVKHFSKFRKPQAINSLNQVKSLQINNQDQSKKRKKQEFEKKQGQKKQSQSYQSEVNESQNNQQDNTNSISSSEISLKKQQSNMKKTLAEKSKFQQMGKIPSNKEKQNKEIQKLGQNSISKQPRNKISMQIGKDEEINSSQDETKSLRKVSLKKQDVQEQKDIIQEEKPIYQRKKKKMRTAKPSTYHQ